MLTSDAPQALLQPGADLTLPGVVPVANAVTRRGGALVRARPRICWPSLGPVPLSVRFRSPTDTHGWLVSTVAGRCIWGAVVQLLG